MMALALALSVALGPPAAGQARAAELIITQPWARASAAPHAPVAAYLTIGNRGAEHDRLVSLAAGQARAAELIITQPWARASAAPHAPVAAYLAIGNRGAEQDRLVSLAAPVAARVELHSHKIIDNVVRHRLLDAIEITSGETTALRPGGLHIQLVGLKTPLREGQTFPLTLTFEKAGSIVVEVVVEAPGAKRPTGDSPNHKWPGVGRGTR